MGRPRSHSNPRPIDAWRDLDNRLASTRTWFRLTRARPISIRLNSTPCRKSSSSRIILIAAWQRRPEAFPIGRGTDRVLCPAFRNRLIDICCRSTARWCCVGLDPRLRRSAAMFTLCIGMLRGTRSTRRKLLALRRRAGGKMLPGTFRKSFFQETFHETPPRKNRVPKASILLHLPISAWMVRPMCSSTGRNHRPICCSFGIGDVPPRYLQNGPGRLQSGSGAGRRTVPHSGLRRSGGLSPCDRSGHDFEPRHPV